LPDVPATAAAPACRICGNAAGNRLHYPREMMFGWGETFEYLECGACGCLQIAEVPADLARYYPARQYYSYKPPRRKAVPGWMLRLRHARTRAFLGEPTLAGRAIAALSKRPEHFDWFSHARLALGSRILDVGCGAGALLLKLQREGFRRLLGADPFIEADIDYGNGVRVLKRRLEQLDGEFDFIMLHHSFEHMPEPAAALRELRRLAAPGSTLLVRIPVADCEARRRYGVNWVAWDAPRHLYLHTRQSLQRLAAGSGFEIAEVVHDSGTQQFASSELYLRGVPYVEHGRYKPGNGPQSFSQAEFAEFQRQADELNRRGAGDTACFYLRPAGSAKGNA
jgi:SAM-dependent methyltransferase